MCSDIMEVDEEDGTSLGSEEQAHVVHVSSI